MKRSSVDSVWKHHYMRFPDMAESDQPEPYDDSSKEAIGVFLIFDRFFDKEETAIEDWLVNSACWARRSWLLNTDAVERGIPLKFFVDDRVEYKVRQLLAWHGVRDEDICVFLGESFHESSQHHFNGAGGAQCAIYSYDSFYEYDWVLQIDADMFMARPPGCDGVYPFFQTLVEYTGDLGDHAVVHLHGQKHMGDLRWPVLKREGHPESRQEWIDIAKEVAGRNIDSGSVFQGLSAAITAFRAKSLCVKAGPGSTSLLRWMTDVGRRLQSDEGLHSLMDFMGMDVWGIMNKFGIDGVWSVSDLHRIREKGEFYLSHMGLPHEWDWRADIGVDDE